jgi:zeaxanthin epoxidase
MATSSTAISLPGASCRARTLLALPSMSAPRRGPGRARFVTAAAMPPAPEPKARVLVAAKRKGFDVVVLERDVSAVRGEGRYRGPIQLQSNALAAVEAIDTAAADEVMDAGCVTGDRINGIVDGISGSW